MADDGKLDKLKEQYIDEILAIVPLSQAVFLVLMVLVSDQIVAGKSVSVVVALQALGLKSSLGPEDGHFWNVGLFSICVCFCLALFNSFLMRALLSASLRRARISDSLASWQTEALARVSGLNDGQKQVIQASFKLEIDSRMKKYRAKRISVEVIVSLVFVGLYGNALLVFLAQKGITAITWSWLNALFIAFLSVVSIGLHRASVRYVIAKVLPLKIYIAALTGELVFFEDITG